MRGEYFLSDSVELIASGLPPHAWGIRKAIPVLLANSGITPTCVGNTAIADRSTFFQLDYPHMRGEYVLGFNCNMVQGGLPPHAWGIH